MLLTTLFYPQLLLFGLHSLVLTSLFLLFFVRNAILSVLLLVTIFVLNALLFLFVNAFYLSVVLVIVYVGAIAILFLFVIMLTNRVYTIRYSSTYSFIRVFFVLVAVEVLFLGGLNFFGPGLFWFSYLYDSLLVSDLRSQIVLFAEPLSKIGFVFFNYFGLYLVGLGVVLLLVLVGVVLLLRGVLGNRLVVDRSYVQEVLRWRRLLAFRQFVGLRS